MFRLRRPRYPVHTARQVVAVALGLVALVLAVRPEPPPVAAAAAVPVVVAAADLAPGTVLTADRLAVVRFPAGLAPEGVTGDRAAREGRVLAGGVRAGEPLTDVRLVGAGLTALLPEGEVAAPVRLADLGVASLVRTGDRVDVLATPPDAEAADVVAAGALVLTAPSGQAAAGPDPSAGLLLLAVEPATATRLAAVSAAATLTISLPRSGDDGVGG